MERICRSCKTKACDLYERRRTKLVFTTHSGKLGDGKITRINISFRNICIPKYSSEIYVHAFLTNSVSISVACNLLNELPSRSRRHNEQVNTNTLPQDTTIATMRCKRNLQNARANKPKRPSEVEKRSHDVDWDRVPFARPSTTVAPLVPGRLPTGPKRPSGRPGIMKLSKLTNYECKR